MAIALYLSCVRRLLKKTGGYECQEGDSTFMLAFERPLAAIQFCLLVSLSLHGRVHTLAFSLRLGLAFSCRSTDESSDRRDG